MDFVLEGLLDDFVHWMSPFLNILGWIYLCTFAILFIISSYGSHIGLRHLYIKVLLKLFAFTSETIENRCPQKIPSVSLDDDSEPIIAFTSSRSFESVEDLQKFQLGDIISYIKDAMSSVIQDSVIPNFISEELPHWNLLTRTNNKSYEFVSFRLTVFWVLGVLIRYLLLLPLRLIILLCGMILLFICTCFIGLFPEGWWKRKLNACLSKYCFDFAAGCLSLVATFHNTENKPQSGIAVANHTSPIDSLVLATDNCYDMVGQIHGGLLGYFMTLMSRSSSHIWFERSEAKDRAAVSRRLKEHASNPDLPPILIYPEGVCVNNTSVLQFKKGAFEIDTVIYPIAIKFDPRFGDAYWWQDTFFPYVLYLMTSWAVVCDVWYLPPMRRKETETAACFASRVKSCIAEQGGLLDLSLDGFLKMGPKMEELKKKQKEFAETYKHRNVHQDLCENPNVEDVVVDSESKNTS